MSTGQVETGEVENRNRKLKRNCLWYNNLPSLLYNEMLLIVCALCVKIRIFLDNMVHHGKFAVIINFIKSVYMTLYSCIALLSYHAVSYTSSSIKLVPPTINKWIILCMCQLISMACSTPRMVFWSALGHSRLIISFWSPVCMVFWKPNLWGL